MHKTIFLYIIFLIYYISANSICEETCSSNTCHLSCLTQNLDKYLRDDCIQLCKSISNKCINFCEDNNKIILSS